MAVEMLARHHFIHKMKIININLSSEYTGENDYNEKTPRKKNIFKIN